MDSAAARPRDQKRAVIWGRSLNALMAGFFLVEGIQRLFVPICWVEFLLAAACVYRAFTYQPSHVDKAVSEAMVLGWAVTMLGTLPPLMLVMMSVWVGWREPLMWAILLAATLVPGFIVWRYFRGRKA